MKREVLKIYLIITFFFFLMVISYFLYKESNNILKDNFVTFNKKSGFYDDTITIKLHKNIDLPLGTKLFYTLDGNDPTNESTKYNGSIKLEMIENETKVYPLKVVAYYKGKYSNIVENTYVIDKDIKDNDINIVSITANYDDLYDYDKGILVPGKIADENIKNGMTGYIRGNYNERDEEWEKPANIKIFNKSGELLYDKKSGLIVSGNTSPGYETKSLKIIANKYDTNNNFSINFYKDYNYLNNSFINNYNSLRLRSGSQDMTNGNVRSSVVSRVSMLSKFDGCTTTERAIVFLNGQFYGVHDIQQNYSNSFLANKFNLKNSEMITKVKGSEALLKDAFSKYYETKNINDLEKNIDMDNYILYYAIEILLNNTDWPQNSFEAWKYDGEYDENNPYTDGRYRFLIYDTDLVYLGKTSYIFFEGADGDTFKSIMENKNRGQGY